jgi:hypothetical protein
MKLQNITFTGIDGKTDLGALWELQQQYPIAEFGVLVAKNWRENGNRYFNPSYLDALDGRGLNLSAHLCGSIARAAVRGDFEPFRDWARSFPFTFNRCQLNIATSKENPNSFELCLDTLLFDEIILQQKSVDDCELYFNSNTNKYVTVLLDASGGDGIDTPIRVLKGRKVGYAGGINPDNVAEKLTFLMENEAVGDFWIDMESGVRTDDWFDINKVVKVLEICNDVLNGYK